MLNRADNRLHPEKNCFLWIRCSFGNLRFCTQIVKALVADINQQVETDHNEIKNVKDNNIPFGCKVCHVVGIDKLRGDASNVTEENQKKKREALSLRRSRFVRFHYIQRPGSTKTDNHNKLCQ